VLCWLDRVRIAGSQLRFGGFPGVMMVAPGIVGKVVRNKNGFFSVQRSLLPDGTILATT